MRFKVLPLTPTTCAPTLLLPSSVHACSDIKPANILLARPQVQPDAEDEEACKSFGKYHIGHYSCQLADPGLSYDKGLTEWPPRHTG